MNTYTTYVKDKEGLGKKLHPFTFTGSAKDVSAFVMDKTGLDISPAMIRQSAKDGRSYHWGEWGQDLDDVEANGYLHMFFEKNETK